MAGERGLLVAMAKDGNSNFNPCVAGPGVGVKDGFSFGVVFGVADGENRTWPHSNPQNFSQNPNPCESPPPPLLANTEVSVFRPRVDEITILRFSLADADRLRTKGLDAFSVFATGTENKDRLAAPRRWFVGNSIVPSYTLIVNLDKGKLESFRWKRESCRFCGDGQCISYFDGYPDAQSSCAFDRSTSQQCKEAPMRCELAIQVTWAGTDKDSAVLKSWYQVDSLGKYSLSDLYVKAETSVYDQYNRTKSSAMDTINGLANGAR
ncbi:hypothetical protein CBR_g78629 [Chara braunii]|uniref:Uncharacterized protein n=1 Tax=Chara braunii TaxID=69332 RepID=A0A388JKG2_CHABU|nr:hypothetical protein CBR_g78629 [Chara braunii]|eukprot:GBG45181.1 hypothetical protein CBR_g78629 [Chara braunii]